MAGKAEKSNTAVQDPTIPEALQDFRDKGEQGGNKEEVEEAEKRSQEACQA